MRDTIDWNRGSTKEEDAGTASGRGHRAPASRASRRGVRWGLVGAGAAGVALGAALLARVARGGRAGGRGAAETHVRARHVVRIERPSDELYRFWRDLSNLPRVMPHLASVEEEHGSARSHWVAKGPMGARVAWDAFVTDEIPGELISWRSEEGSQLRNSGTVQFLRVSDRVTDLIASLEYVPPGGRAGERLANWLGWDGERELRRDLERFRDRVNRGELALEPTR